MQENSLFVLTEFEDSSIESSDLKKKSAFMLKSTKDLCWK